jgi:hypothetical protein
MHVDAAAKADLEKMKQESIAKGVVYYVLCYAGNKKIYIATHVDHLNCQLKRG